MQSSLAKYLACPECGGELKPEIRRENLGKIQEGSLVCSNCQEHYPIESSIPRLLPRHLAAHQQKTRESFGIEWRRWRRFGWDEEVSMEKTRRLFDYKVMATPEELEGKLVLDAGCGNGRYTQVAADYGAEVIGVDLSDAVEVAFENTKNNPRIHIVQGDLFRLPFKKELFDFIFSNGVLMHTGDAKKAFFSLLPYLKPDGAITIHLYHKGNPLYEFNDWWLRSITTRLPFSWVMLFSKILAGFAKLFPQKIVEIMNAVFHLERGTHYLFDWYTAPIATHHTYPEVYGWLKEGGLYLIADHNATRRPWRKWVLPFFFLTVKAQKQPVSAPARHTID